MATIIGRWQAWPLGNGCVAGILTVTKVLLYFGIDQAKLQKKVLLAIWNLYHERRILASFRSLL